MQTRKQFHSDILPICTQPPILHVTLTVQTPQNHDCKHETHSLPLSQTNKKQTIDLIVDGNRQCNGFTFYGQCAYDTISIFSIVIWNLPEKTERTAFVSIDFIFNANVSMRFTQNYA